MGGIQIAVNFSQASQASVSATSVSATPNLKKGPTLGGQLQGVRSQGVLAANASSSFLATRAVFEPKASLPLNLSPGKNRSLAPPCKPLWDRDVKFSTEEPASPRDTQNLPEAGVESASMQSQATLPWQESLRSGDKRDAPLASPTRPYLRKGDGQEIKTALRLEKKAKAKQEIKTQSNEVFKSDAEMSADFSKRLRPWLNGESSPRSPSEFLKKGEGEINRVNGIRGESKKRLESIQSERTKESLRQEREARRVETLNAKALRNPNLALREKLKGMRARISAPGFDPGLPLLGDSTYSRAFYVSGAVMERPEPAPNLKEEPVVSGKQSPTINRHSPLGDEGISSASAESDMPGKSEERVVRMKTRGQRNRDYRRSLSSQSAPLSGASSCSAFSETRPFSTEKAKRNSSVSSVDSGTEAMSDGETIALPEERLAPVSRPGTPMRETAFTEQAASAPVVQRQRVSTQARQIPRRVAAVSTPSLAVSTAVSTAPKVKTGGWVRTAYGTWERRTETTEEKAKLYEDQSRPVLTTRNRQLPSSVR